MENLKIEGIGKGRNGEDRDYFSPSLLKQLAKGADEFQEYIDKVFEGNASTEFGTLIHTLILEPKTFKSRYAIFDDKEIVEEILDSMPEAKRAKAKPRATKKYTEFKAAFLEANKDKTVATISDLFRATHIVNKVKKSGVYDTFFTDGIAEKTYIKEVEVDGVMVKMLCIVDYVGMEWNVDLKTTSEKDYTKIKFQAYKYSYDVQAKVTEMITGKPFVFIYVQTVAPYKVVIHEPSGLFLQSGESKIKEAIENYSFWKDNGAVQVARLNF